MERNTCQKYCGDIISNQNEKQSSAKNTFLWGGVFGIELFFLIGFFLIESSLIFFINLFLLFLKKMIESLVFFMILKNILYLKIIDNKHNDTKLYRTQEAEECHPLVTIHKLRKKSLGTFWVSGRILGRSL